jgi:ESS family glutamate:Na+ symporter
VCALFAAINLTNAIPRLVPDLALGVLPAMSLMNLQLWTLQGLGGPLLLILAVQVLIAFASALLIVFRVMGRDSQAAVVCAGFGGFSMGATPPAMANMAAVTRTCGPAERAFLILPLVSGFLVDITNSLVIQRFISWLG